MPAGTSGKDYHKVVKSPASAGDSKEGRCPRGERGKLHSVLAWKISGTGEPGGLQSMGLQRVR